MVESRVSIEDGVDDHRFEDHSSPQRQALLEALGIPDLASGRTEWTFWAKKVVRLLFALAPIVSRVLRHPLMAA
jgi:hypothetical protein